MESKIIIEIKLPHDLALELYAAATGNNAKELTNTQHGFSFLGSYRPNTIKDIKIPVGSAVMLVPIKRED